MTNNIEEDMWVALVLKTGAKAIGRTYTCPVDNKIAVRYVGDAADGIVYVDEVEAIAEITINWGEAQ